MIIGVSELDVQRLCLAIREDCPNIDHMFIRDEEGQLYLFAHGIERGMVIVNGMEQEPWEHVHDYFFDGEHEEPLHELEDVKVICCCSANMEWGEFPYGVNVTPLIETPYPVRQWFHKRKDGLYDIEVYENRD
jgi:hypothetical protein